MAPIPPVFRDIKRRFEIAGDRLAHGAGRLVSLVQHPVSAARSAGVALGLSRHELLSPEEQQGIAAFSNSEAFSDRSRMVSFEAVDPSTGRRGQYRTSVNGLLLIEPSYDAAKQQIQNILGNLVNDGVLTYDKPLAPPDVRALQNRTPLGAFGEDGNPAYGGTEDSRMWSGGWANWPEYGGLVNPGYDEAATAINYTRFSPGPFLAGLPLPRDWRRIYPTRKLFDRGVFPDEAFMAALQELTRQIVLLVKGANANPEWHPALVYFLNGVPAPYFTGQTWDNVDLRYQYKDLRRWCKRTESANPRDAGLVPVGASDILWQMSMRSRAPRYWAQRVRPIARHNWASLTYADAVADFVQIANLASFVADLGATAHVHACLEQHAAVAQKAYAELGETFGAGLDGYLARVARERQAREVRASQSGGGGGTGLALVAGATNSPDRQIANQLLNGAAVASAQLFLVSPLIGGVALGITAVAVLITNLIMGRPYECNGSNLLVRDGRVPVRDTDLNECSGAHGDVYGGNYLPHTRAQAIQARPVVRVKDALGREL